MTKLNRTRLAAPLKTLLAATALASDLLKEVGSKADIARHFELSRPTVYAAARTARQVLERHFDRPDHIEDVAVNRRLLERTIIALYATAPNSMRAISALLPIIYPGVTRSFGFIQDIIKEAAGKAALRNKAQRLDRVKAAALDEMFSQGKPVLAGIDLDSGFLFALQVREHRTAEDWSEVLKDARDTAGLKLETVVRDGASGIQAGVARAFPDAEQRDDHFHVLRDMGKEKRRLGKRAFRTMTAEYEAEHRLAVYRGRSEKKRRHLLGRLVWARRECFKAMEAFDRFDSLSEEARDAMNFVDLNTGGFRSSEKMEADLRDVASRMEALPDERSRRVGQMLARRARGVSSYADELLGRLFDLWGEFEAGDIALGCAFHQLREELASGRRPWLASSHREKLMSIYHHLRRVYGADGCEALLEAVLARLADKHRASSSIEGFNAALRPHVYVQKRASEGFLELFRFAFNHRRRSSGRFKGQSPVERVTGVPCDDWLAALGYPALDAR